MYSKVMNKHLKNKNQIRFKNRQLNNQMHKKHYKYKTIKPDLISIYKIFLFISLKEKNNNIKN